MLYYQVISTIGNVIIFFVFCYRAYGSGKEDNPMCDVAGFENCKMKLLRHVSFVDCPVKL
jgi:translation initiation factor 2 gamma subunit (eIF-2gamma)